MPRATRQRREPTDDRPQLRLPAHFPSSSPTNSSAPSCSSALRRPSAVSAIQADEERIRAERVGQIAHQQAADSRRVIRSAAGQAIEADGTGEAEALLRGDEFEAGLGQLGRIRRQ